MSTYVSTDDTFALDLTMHIVRLMRSGQYRSVWPLARQVHRDYRHCNRKAVSRVLSGAFSRVGRSQS